MKARKQDHSWAFAEIFPGGQRRHFVYQLQIAEDQCFLWNYFTL